MPAFRTVSESDDIHTIEGVGYPFNGPFNGKDTWGTTFSARTDFVWDLFPDSETEPRFTRPVTYNHGFDAEVGLRRVGGWSPVRTDTSGVWVQAQLDKHDAYYGAIRELLDKHALGFSGGSAEHAIRVDDKTGEIRLWPAYEMALTPTPSNPYAMIASRSAETARLLVAIHPAGYIPSATPATRYSEAASNAAMGAGTLGSLLYLLSSEADEPDQVAMIQKAIDALSEWLDAERAEVGTAEDLAESASVIAYYSASRALRAGATPAIPATPPDDAARSADASALVTITSAPVNADTLREIALRVASAEGAEVARRLLQTG